MYLNHAIYGTVASEFWSFMVQKLFEASPVVYSRRWCALNGPNRPSTAQDRPLQKIAPGLHPGAGLG